MRLQYLLAWCSKISLDLSQRHTGCGHCRRGQGEDAEDLGEVHVDGGYAMVEEREVLVEDVKQELLS